MKRYNKAIDYALLAMHYARKAEMSKSATVKAAFRKKAVQAALNSGKQKDTLDGMKTLEASLRIAAENEGMLPPVDDELDMEEDMPMEAEDDMMDDVDIDDVDIDDVDMDIQEVDAEAEDIDDDEDAEESEDDEDEDEDDDEAVEAFNRVAARVRARRLAARKLQARRQIAARARARRLAARRATR